MKTIDESKIDSVDISCAECRRLGLGDAESEEQARKNAAEALADHRQVEAGLSRGRRWAADPELA
jgi:hypothetical protein